MSNNPTVPIACNLAAIPQDKRAEHQQNTEHLFQSVLDTQELPDGYAFRIAWKSSILPTIAAFIEYERQCCPSLHFTVIVEAANGPLWLHLTGSEGAKSFIQVQFLGLK